VTTRSQAVLRMQPFDFLSDEMLEYVLSNCSAHSLVILIPRVSKRWSIAASHALESLVHLNTRFTPMREWPRDLSTNIIDPARHAQHQSRNSPSPFLTRAQRLSKYGEAMVQKEDELEASSRESGERERQSTFVPDAYKWYRMPPRPLGLARCDKGLLWSVDSHTTETGIEFSLGDTKIDRSTWDRDCLTVLAHNLRHMLSKTPRLERLEILADVFRRRSMHSDEISWRVLDLNSFMPAPVAARLKELTVYGKFSNSNAKYIADACPNLEKLAYDVCEMHMFCSMFIGWDLSKEGSMHALTTLRVKCPKLTTIPLLEIPTSMDHTAVDIFFATLRVWSTLHKVLILSYAFNSRLVANAKDFEGNRGSFEGKLSVECGYVCESCSEEEYELYEELEGHLLVNQPHVCVYMDNISC
jgi:hypothetical protein